MFGVVLIFTPFIDEDGDLRGGGERVSAAVVSAQRRRRRRAESNGVERIEKAGRAEGHIPGTLLSAG